MLVVVYITFSCLILIGSFMGFYSWKSNQKISQINNPTFTSFQAKYFRVYLLALLAEWLQGPYLYQLYHSYGFVDPYIGIIYVSGYISSIFFGTYAGLMTDYVGRKRICVLFTILYSICCLTKISRNFAILCLGRVLGGISTSLLFTSFDSWYIYEHIEKHQFPSEWLDVTFSKATFYNSIIAISAGIISNILSESLDFGPVAPFILAIPFLFIAGLLIQTTWDENYGKTASVMKTCGNGLKAILKDRNVFLIGTVQSMFESVMYIFVFLWTPVLLPTAPPLGIVFSCFMFCIWIGSMIYDFLQRKRYTTSAIIIAVIYAVMLTNAGSAYASAHNPTLTFLLFLMTEILCGIYFPAMGKLRKKVLPGNLQQPISNWFRVPLNAIASAVLLILHDSHSHHGITHLFILCACLLLCCGLFAILLRVSGVDLIGDENEMNEGQS